MTEIQEYRRLVVLFGERNWPRLPSSLFNKCRERAFDVISVQFALHYFFESEEVFEGFISNIDDNLKSGGMLIGIIYIIFSHLSSVQYQSCEILFLRVMLISETAI